MEKEFTTATPRYEIRSPGWEHLEIFNDLKEAFQSVFELAIRFPDTDFLIIKKVNWEEAVIFRLNLNLSCGLDNVQDFYKSMVSLFQNKLIETIAWRKEDGR